MRRVRALIALLSSNFGRGASGVARIWASRIAVTQHITDRRPHEVSVGVCVWVVPALAAGRGSCRPRRGFWWAARWIKAVTEDRLVASRTVARGFEASGAVWA